MIASLITTYNRPQALARSLPQIAALGAASLVVDDGSEAIKAAENERICRDCDCLYIRLPQNKGLAEAMNAGLNYWLEHQQVQTINYMQDDTDCHPKTLEVLSRLSKHGVILTGHDAAAHKSHASMAIDGIPVKYKWSCAGVHIFARADFWKGILPIPTYAPGAPKRNGNGKGRGIGSNADWWICRDAPRSSRRLGHQILCVPNLVRTFYWKPEDSSWGNFLPTGEEPPLRAL